jgi:thiamine-phosphate pyrophosphorylase
LTEVVGFFMGLVIPRLYAIMDPAQLGARDPAVVLDALLDAGVRCVQYRDKQSSALELFKMSKRLGELARRSGCTLIINDRADIALAVDADGVHVGQDDLGVELARRVVGPHRWVGYSTHDLAQVRQASASSANYIAFGPIFKTRSKARPDPVVGLEGLRRAREATGKPLVAIGGITAENARAVMEAGADAVAVIHDLIAAPDPASRAKEFLKVLGANAAGTGA